MKNRYRLVWYRDLPQVVEFEVMAESEEAAILEGSSLDERNMLDWDDDETRMPDYRAFDEEIELIETGEEIEAKRERAIFDEHPKLPGFGGREP